MKCVVLSCFMALTFGFPMEEEPTETCEYKGEMYSNGFVDREACKGCHCHDGKAECHEWYCEWIECPNGEAPIKTEHECCPSCASEETDY